MRFFSRFLAAVLVAAAIPAHAQSAARDSGLILSTLSQAVSRAPLEVEDLSITVDLSDRVLYVLDGERVVRRYPVAVGAADYPTPRGSFRISRMIWNPSWRPPASGWARSRKPEAPGAPGNPMGRIKIFFREPDFYIHGTGTPSSLGRAASHGCIRLRNVDAAELGRLLMASTGTERDRNWFRRVVDESSTSHEVRLARGVPLRVRA
jgi:L,D-transpeptidase ErfK/SrfK